MSEKSLDEKNIEVISIPFSDSSEESVSNQSSILENAKKKLPALNRNATSNQTLVNNPKTTNKTLIYNQKTNEKNTSKNVNKPEFVNKNNTKMKSNKIKPGRVPVSDTTVSETTDSSEDDSESETDQTTTSTKSTTTSSYSTNSSSEESKKVPVWKNKKTRNVLNDFAIFLMVIIITMIAGTIFLRREPDLKCWFISVVNR